MTQLRRIQEALIRAGTYIDPINRERDLYLGGFISVEEFERRVEKLLRS